MQPLKSFGEICLDNFVTKGNNKDHKQKQRDALSSVELENFTFFTSFKIGVA